jgi:hypothetical protein
LHPIQVRYLVDWLHYTCAFGNSIMGCGWCNIEHIDLIVLFLASFTPMILWGLGPFHNLLTGFKVTTLSNLTIIMNYEIHAPIEMKRFNCKIPRIYLKPYNLRSMEHIWWSLATLLAFFASAHDIDLTSMIWCMLASLCASITTFFGDCVKIWLGTLVDILIDICLKHLHSNLNSHT